MAHEDMEHAKISTCYEIHMLYSCDVYAVTHTHTCTHINQSCSPSLWQRLGLPDLHSSRYVYRQRGDEIAPSASLCSISSVLSSACSLPLGQTQTHTHRDADRGEETTMISWPPWAVDKNGHVGDELSVFDGFLNKARAVTHFFFLFHLQTPRASSVCKIIAPPPQKV